MRIVAGTSGFSYPEWRGSFYPEGLPESSMLGAYSQRLSSVEINNTFYRVPKASLLEGWAGKVPDDFTFALKTPRRITHMGKLQGVGELVEYFLNTARSLGSKLGPVLFQLPPFLRKDLGVLRDFVALLPAGLRGAFEFRHESWFSDDTYGVLAERQMALVAAEVDPDEGTGAPFVRTAPFSYVRLRRAVYDAASIDAALTRLSGLGVDDAFVYFKHEVLGPSYALELLARHRGSASG